MADKNSNKNWNLVFDQARGVIVYDTLNNHLGEHDENVEVAFENMATIASKLNLLVEAEINCNKFQLNPGMTSKDGFAAWKKGSDKVIHAKFQKRTFMEKHQQQLNESRMLTEEALHGLLVADLPQYEKIGQSSNDAFANFVISSHLFQDIVAHSPEFSAILRDVKKAAKIYVLGENIFKKQRQKIIEQYENGGDDLVLSAETIQKYANEHVFDWSKESIFKDKAKDYDLLHVETKKALRNEFYRRHKDDLPTLLGAENWRFLRNLFKQNDEALSAVLLQEERSPFKVPQGCLKFKIKEDLKPVDDGFTFVKALCRGKQLQRGNKILLTGKAVKSKTFGELTKYDAFRYENGKYEHFYQEYTQKGDRNMANTVNITKAIQQLSADLNQNGKSTRLF